MTQQKVLFFCLVALLSLTIISSCAPKTAPSEDVQKIENTLKSVTLLIKPPGVDMAKIKASFDDVNAVIGTIGFPDAGYQLWTIQSADSVGFELMVEGHWPDQQTYDLIHEDERYQTATKAPMTEWEKLERVSYHRFQRME